MRTPQPRVDKGRKMVCVFSTHLRMFEVCQITNKGKVSMMFKPQTAFTTDVKEAFRRFTVPFAKFRAVPGMISKKGYRSWNEYVEAVWAAGK